MPENSTESKLTFDDVEDDPPIVIQVPYDYLAILASIGRVFGLDVLHLILLDLLLPKDDSHSLSHGRLPKLAIFDFV
jgi:hypothetical protein